MELDIFNINKEYISAGQASKKSEYTSDYIGQLCRTQKISGKLVGRTWYVDLGELLEHKRTRQLSRGRKPRLIHSNELLPREKGPFSKEAKLIYQSDFKPYFPTLSKTSPQTKLFRKTLIVRGALVFSLVLITMVVIKVYISLYLFIVTL